ncbi:ankyrin repeat-containing domain protein [Biscogniauxia marginata]|nr:ankyrin repeat-containing domain protein [Biscogniauxia marginata]
MTKIYGGAERVLFYLGRLTDSTRAVMATLEELQKRVRDISAIRERDDIRWDNAWGITQSVFQASDPNWTIRQRQGLMDLLQRSWFRRVWILQEVASARKALVYCGTKWVPARIFAVYPRLIGVEPSPHCQAVLYLMPGFSTRTLSSARGRDLYSLLMRFSGSEASDDRDKVYALLGLCTHTKSDKRLVADHTKSIKDVIRDTFSYLCDERPQLATFPQHSTLDGGLSSLESLDDVILLQGIKSNDWKLIEDVLETRVVTRPITEGMIVLAATNTYHARILMDLFLKHEMKITITDAVFRAMHGDSIHGFSEKGLMEFLLQHPRKELVAFEMRNMAKSIQPYLQNEDILTLLDRADILEQGGRALLLEAVMIGNTYLLNLLLEKRVDIECWDDNGYTPLWHAVGKGYETVAQLLLNRGANIDHKSGCDETPLWRAAYHGNNTMIQLLLDNNATVDARNRHGRTPLCSAANNGCRPDCIQLLLEKGATIDATDNSGKTPLMLAAYHGHASDVELLIDKGANIETRDCNGWTALHLAAAMGHNSIMQWLVNKGADMDCRNKSNHTPLQVTGMRG